MRIHQISTASFVFIAVFTSHFAHAEGSYQTGLNQPFVEYDAVVFNYLHNEPLHVDIHTANEVINISLCGNENTDDIQAEIYNPSGTLVRTFTHDQSNVACDDAFTAPLPLNGLQGPFQYTATTVGTYSIHLYNATTDFLGNTDNLQLIRRFDITVTPDNSTLPDPSAQAGRLWSREWSFWTQSFDESEATDANYYPLVPGGRADTHYVWKLDLNNFSGNWYTLVANSVGVAAPRSGYSVPESGNSVSPEYPVYLSYPAMANPLPGEPPEISGLTFTDDAGVDYGISPGTTPDVQNSGTFAFTTDVDGTYALVIDTNKDGQFGVNDTLLLGSVTSGLNQISWNGTDANGNTLPPDIYNTQLRVSLGEYHFVVRDAETSGGNEDGLTIFQANADGSTSNTQVYWDDATLLSSPAGTTTLPNGQSSATSAGRHTWGDFSENNFGNQRYIDTYVYGLTVNATTQVAIVLDDVPLSGSDGSVAFSVTSSLDNAILITVTDLDLNTDSATAQNVVVQVINDNTGEQEQILLTETGPDTAIFSNVLTTLQDASTGTNNDGVLNTQNGQTLTVTYYDQLHSADTGGIQRTAQIITDPDTDNDGIANSLDLDSDNDGIPNTVEGDNSVDTDGDGTPDYLDLDSDNDGLFDVTESGISDPASLDTDNDGRIDTDNTVGANGLADIIETGIDSGSINYTVVDTDGDTIDDFRDLDSDNDGTPDANDAFPTDNSEIADSDGDGVGNNADLDADNDGIPDSIEGDDSIDSDADGTPDYLDLDSDGDGINDIIEAGGSDTDNNGQVDAFTDDNNDGLDDNLAITPLPLTDSNGDGTPDYRDNTDSDADGLVNSHDFDSDNDGIPDSIEGGSNVDTDGDGIADYLDLDSDNDGIPDLIESGINNPAVLDGDNDGRIDASNPVGNNGFADAVETATDSGRADYNGDGNADAPRDTDSDGIPDYRDPDSDNDGINDIIEAGGTDTNDDGRIDNPVDTNSDGLDDSLVNSPLPDIHTDADSDGIPDYRDNDDLDNDGITDTLDLDTDNDGIPDLIEGSDTNVDTDSDGIPDYRDLDSDNDGLFDLTESGITDLDSLDGNNDGRIDNSNTVGANGLADIVETSADSGAIRYTVADTDNDGIDDYRDRDADNDGIPDVTESGGNDPDGDGVPGTGTPDVTNNGLVTGAGLNPTDTDNDGTPDHHDLDSDNDGSNDIIEAGGNDIDGDGQVDGFTDANNDGLDDTIAANPLPLPDTDNNGIPDYRDNGDLDNDGIADTFDLDDDNDGIPDLIEGRSENIGDSVDTDGDGIFDYRDLDSDNDGLFDLRESGISAYASLDTDNDGRINVSNAMGNNGLADAVETSADSNSINYTVANTDGDAFDDYRDLDSDGDGIPDVTESNRSDADTNGRIGTGNPPANFNGLVSGSGTTTPDSDTDGVPDYRDLDSDNDSITDVVEAGGTDNNGDGRQDPTEDNNNGGDGFDDAVQAMPLPLYDTDNDGTPDYRDIDTDSDGVADLSESGSIDRDRDGRVDDFSDLNNDGLDDDLSGIVLDLPDSNNNDLPDYRDPATARSPDTVLTGLNGVGGCTLNPETTFDPTLPLLLFIALFSLWRRKPALDKHL